MSPCSNERTPGTFSLDKNLGTPNMEHNKSGEVTGFESLKKPTLTKNMVKKLKIAKLNTDEKPNKLN